MDRPDERIPALEDQERRLVPPRFDTDAGSQGRRLVDVVRERGLGIMAGTLAASATP
jgi:hypothetical protein